MMSYNFSDNTPVWQGLAKTHYAVAGEGGAPHDLCIVGAGILGLVTALNAARAGLSVCVVEASQIGEGASGLNGGQVIPGLKHGYADIITQLGPGKGEVLADFADGTAERVFDLIAKEKLRVAFMRTGWIQAALTPPAIATAEKRVKELQMRGAAVELLDQQQVKTLIGAEGYIGGWIDRRAGVINPLAYVQELARIAAAAGVQIYEKNKALRLLRSGTLWTVETTLGTVTATKVLLATNAYSDDLLPQLRRSVVPLHSFQIATAQLPHGIINSILPGGQAVSDSRRVLAYYRRSDDSRLVLGGRGRMAVPRHANDWHHLTRTMVRLFPQLRNVKIEKRWFGRVCVTPDYWPHLHQPETDLWAFVGCQGRGIGLMTAMGERLGQYFADGDIRHLPFPVTPINPIAFHGLHKVGVATTIATYRILDSLGW